MDATQPAGVDTVCSTGVRLVGLFRNDITEVTESSEYSGLLFLAKLCSFEQLTRSYSCGRALMLVCIGIVALHMLVPQGRKWEIARCLGA